MAAMDQRRLLLLRTRLQRVFSHLLFLPFGGTLILAFRYVLGYRIEEMQEWRRKYAGWMAEGRPLLICANHLTYVDSILLILAFSGHFRYWLDFRTFPWNLPAAEYKRNPFFALVGYFNKCIFIDRRGPRAHHDAVFHVAGALLAENEVFTIFPEGRRSRTGRFDDSKLAFGLGRLAASVPRISVVCVYLRAQGQDKKSGFPKPGSVFQLRAERLELEAGGADAAAQRQITRRIAQCIQGLESSHFSCRIDNAGYVAR